MLYFDIEGDWQKFKELRLQIAHLETELSNFDTGRTDEEIGALEVQLESARIQMEKMTKTAMLAGENIQQGFQRKLETTRQLVQDYSTQIMETNQRIKNDSEKIAFEENKIRNPNLSGKERNAYLQSIQQTKIKLEEEKETLARLTMEREKATISMERQKAEYDLLIQEQEQANQTAKGLSSGVTKIALALGGFSAVKGFISNIKETRAQFQNMEAALNTMVGENKAGELMEQLKGLAKVSPLAMSDMIAAEKTMLGFGIDANKTVEYIKTLSDVSMGESGKFNSLTLAFSQMSAAGKLMGQDLLQMINAGFNPLEQMSKTTGKSISQLKEEMSQGAISAEMVQKAFVDATKAGGKFAGMSEATAKTINGQMSMLGDAMDNMFNSIGKSTEGVFVSAISSVTKLVESYEKLAPVLAGAVSALGALKVATLVNIKLDEIARTTAIARGVSVDGITMKMKLQTLATNTLSTATKVLNTVMKASPWIAAAAAIGALVTVAIKYHQKQKEINGGTERMSEAMAKNAVQINKEKAALGELQAELENLDETTKEYADKKQELISLANNYDSKIADEIRNVGITADTYIRLAEAIERANNARTASDFVTSERKNIETSRNAFIEEEFANFESRYINKADGKERGQRKTQIRQFLDQIKTQLAEGSLSAEWDAQAAKLMVKGLTESQEKILFQDVGFGNGRDRFIDALVKQIRQEQNSQKAIEGMLQGYDVSYSDLTKGKVGEAKTMREAVGATKTDALKQKNDPKQAETKANEAQAKIKDMQSLIAEMEKNYQSATDEGQRTQIRGMINEVNALISDAEADYKAIQSHILSIKGETYKDALARTEKDWKTAKAEFESIKKSSTATKEEYEKAKAKEETARKAYTALGGDVSEKKKEKDTTADDLKKQIAERQRANNDLQIELMEEGFAQKMALQQKQYDEQIKQIEELEKSVQEAYKSGKIDKETYNQYSAVVSSAKVMTEQSNSQETQQMTQSLIDTYNVYDAKRREIDEKYRKDTLALDTIMASTTATEEQKEQAQKAKSNLDRQKSKDLLSLSVEEFTQGGDYQIVFQNLENFGYETLSRLKEQLSTIGTDIANSMNPVDAQVFWQTYDNILNRIAELNPSEALRVATEENTIAQEEYNQACEEYQDAKMSKDIDKQKKAYDRLVTSENKAKRAQTNLDRAMQASKNKVAKITSALSDLGSSLTSLGGEVEGIGGDVLTVAGDIVSFASGTITSLQTLSETSSKNIEGVSKTTANAIKAVETASVILAIIGMALKVARAIFNLLSKDKETVDEWNSKIIAMTVAVNNYRLAVIDAQHAQERWFSSTGYDNLSDAYERGTMAVKNYYDLLNSKQKSNTLKFASKRTQKSTDASDWYDSTAQNNLWIKTKDEKRWKGGKGENLIQTLRNEGLELFDEEGLINIAEAEYALERYGNKMVGTTRETIEQLIEARKQYDEWVTALQDYVSDMYSPLTDNLTDSLFNWLETGENVMDSFNSYASDTFREIAREMMKSLVTKRIFAGYSDDIAKIYETAEKEGWSEQQIATAVTNRTKQLQQTAEQEVPILEQTLTGLSDTFKAIGVDITGAQDAQNTVAGAFETMSEDTAGVLEARFTALYESSLTLINTVRPIQLGVDNIYREISSGRNILTDARNILANSYLEQSSINRYMGELARFAKVIASDVEEINDKT